MDPIIEFDHVTKEYKLYSGNRQRLASVFFKVNIKKKKAEIIRKILAIKKELTLDETIGWIRAIIPSTNVEV